MENKNTELRESHNPNINSNNDHPDDFDFVDADENTIEEKNAVTDIGKNEANNFDLEKIENKDDNQISKEIEMNNSQVKMGEIGITYTEPCNKSLNNYEKSKELNTDTHVQDLNEMNSFNESSSNTKENEKILIENPIDNEEGDDNSKMNSEDFQMNKRDINQAHLDFVDKTIENQKLSVAIEEREHEMLQKNIYQNDDKQNNILNIELKQGNHLDVYLDNKNKENEKIEDHKNSNLENLIEVEKNNLIEDHLNNAVDLNKNIEAKNDNFDKNEVLNNEIKRDNNEESINNNNNEDFDFFEASEEENKTTNLKETNNDLHDEAFKVNAEYIYSKQKAENTSDSHVELEKNEVSAEQNAYIALNHKREDFQITDKKEDLDIQEIEESEPAEHKAIIDSFVNKNQIKEKLKIEMDNPQSESIEDKTIQNIVDNQEEFIFEEKEEDIKEESKIENITHEVIKEKETEKNQDQNSEEFDFVDETEENINTNTIESKKIENENICDDDPKKSEEGETQKDKESEDEKDEFDAKKIMDYSFSSSEEEEENDKKEKKPSGQIKGEIINKDVVEQKEFIKTEQDDMQDIQENNIEDNLDNLEFEDCSENNENKPVEEIKRGIDAIKNDALEDEDVFDFVEEDNSETNGANNDKINDIGVKAKEDTEKMDKNDEEFDFVEESEPQVNTNSEAKTNSNYNVNQINQTAKNVVFINKDHISNLLNNYRNKFIINNPNFAYLDDTSIKKKIENIQAISNPEKQSNEINESNLKKEEQIGSNEDVIPNIKENEFENKQEIEEDEFLDVENEDEIDKDENKPSLQSPLQPPEIPRNSEDFKREKRLKSLFDLENFTFEINESKFENFDFSQQAMGFEPKQKNEIYKPISIQKHIENLKFFNSVPETNMRGYSLEELNKLSKSFNTKLNIKNTIFNHNVMEFPNEIGRKLFFQFSDLKMIINTIIPLNQFHNANKNSSNINMDSFSPFTFQNNQMNDLSNCINLKAESRENNSNEENKLKKKSNEQISPNPNDNPNSKASSIHNKESLNTTININNTSINENVNKDRILENIKELKLLNEKNTDLFNKNKSNNQSPLSPNTQTNYLEALNNLKDSENSNNQNKIPKTPIKVEKPKAASGIDLQSNKIKMQMKEQKEIDSDSFDEIKEDDDDFSDNEKKDNKPKFVMNEMMSSLFSAVSNNNSSNNVNKANDKPEEIVKEKPKEVTEIDMLEMLKSMGITKKEEKVDNIKNNEIEKNNEKLNEFINRLPNLNYLTSKYVEIPDSIFNI